MWFPLSINYKVTSGIPEYGSCCKRIARRYLDPVQNRLYSRKPSSPATFRSLKRKEQRNLDEKTVICEIVEAMEYDTFTTFQDWENKTQEIIALQAKWKQLVTHLKNEREDIRTFPCRLWWIFQTQSRVLQVHQGKYGRQSGKEESFMWKAEALKESTDWKATADILSKLQKEWKTIGPVPKSIRMPYGNDSLPHVIISSSKRTRRLLHNAQLNRKTWFRKRRSLKS